MLRLSLSILLIVQSLAFLVGQNDTGSDSPHGESLEIDCKKCHTTSAWTVDLINMTFTHDSTDFTLNGQHKFTDCKSCHESLVFKQAPNDCFLCHTDVHQETVGMDCARCHDERSWLIGNVAIIHEQVSFPLEGVHYGVDCKECHSSSTELAFYPIVPECITCHQEDFVSTTDPDHTAAGYSTDCAECHSLNSFDWSADNYDHDFFPLTLGHDLKECSACHENNVFDALSTDCFSCHQQDYEASRSPNHINGDFSVNCTDCHTTNPDWQPAEYLEHDNLYFPIYQGRHSSVWDDCTECHKTPENFSQFSCTHCHEHRQSSMDNEHDDVTGYVYEDQACYACHPRGDGNSIFNHDQSNFPLTGFHRMVACEDCHSDGYLGTPTDCFACHEQDYNESTNPDHKELNISMDCAECHTTDPNWVPASFAIHDDYYPLNGAHALIANDCTSCHNGDYQNTPNDCFSCHQEDYNNTMEPDHETLQFATDCATCHTENAWVPSTFEHDMQYFPIFSGAHEGEWNTCSECHTQADNYQVFSCVDCHEHNQPDTEEEHMEVNGYSYNSPACLACHPTGDADDVFDHNLTNFPLTGAHISTECIACHTDGYMDTPTDCFACHQADFEETQNPDHPNLGINNDCASCHSTEAGWTPATFDIHDDYYPLNGAHQLISNDCASCHNGDYNNTPNTCYACHQEDFTQTTDPPHESLQFSTDCASCHTESAWTPSTFDHDGQYFPVFSGKHQGEWDNCADCHTDNNNYAAFTCVDCHAHQQMDMDEEHQGVGGYSYSSPACLACHPTGDADENFDHNLTAFPLTGAHILTDCIECHENGYQGTSTECFACHEVDFNQSQDPNHTTLALPTDCNQCHTTDPGWAPATFDIHNDYYPLTGAHAIISTDCAACHSSGYNNTPNDCAGCHTADYNQSNNPNHQQLGLSTDCATCHTSDPGWIPAAFDVHDEYYPLNGAHASIANDCASCHNGDYNNTPNTCIACHQTEYDNTNNPNHASAQFSTDCASCHTESSWSPSTFDHDGLYFPIYSGEHNGEWNQCTDCHTVIENYSVFTCTNCHTNPETDEEHDEVGGYAYEDQACLACHPTGSADDGFDHNNTGFPLLGAHQGADCQDCHSNGYQNTSSDCVSCHQEDYNNSQDPNHNTLGLSSDCASCHSSDPGWAPATFEVHDEYFVLDGAHSNISTDCASCHTNGYNNTPNDCAGCHTADYNATMDPDHQQLALSTDCASCHTTDPGWTPATFDVHNDYYPLTGAHANIATDCAACHSNGYANTPNDCIGCHSSDYNSTTEPDHQELALSTDCASCHTTDPGWTPATFDVHNDYYPLTGAHATIATDCAACHSNGYANTPNDCIGCHSSDYNSTTEPDHQELALSTDCNSCHTTEPGWTPATFDVHNDYYPLTGAHAIIATDCAMCHSNGYDNTPSDCAGCHTADYNAASDPDHQQLGLSTDCASCHTTDPGWTPATFDVHNDYYPLTGAHAIIATDCAMCHSNGYDNTPNDCAGCHTADYNAASDPDHQQLGLSTDCASCHTTDPGWTPATFDVHDDYYPLTGAHAIIASDCAMCHSSGYNNTPSDCAGCHTADYNAASDPDHQQLGLSTDCASCHTTDPGWTPATFDVHDDYYPLTGAHAIIASDCAMCHSSGYNNTPSDCAGCHTADYNAASDPDHQQLGLSTDCASCHTTDPGWTPATFDVHDDYYPLTGAHAIIASDCAMCHSSGYNNTPSDCAGCHTADYNAASDPDHQQLGLSTDCASCHTTEPGWTPATFDVHDDYYPLTGAHTIIATDCAMCHSNGYDNTPSDCAGCHTADYNAASDPDHQQLGLSTDCASCHTTDPGWTPATFDVHDDYYPLTGAHALIATDCNSCHSNGYENTPNTCFGCHETEYNNTTDPDHQSAQFPIDCESCHNDIAWEPATFDHDNMYFPIYSGKHDGEWDQCTDCHTVSNNYSIFDCLNCHTNPETDQDHDEVNDYSYDSPSCFACHPDGND